MARHCNLTGGLVDLFRNTEISHDLPQYPSHPHPLAAHWWLWVGQSCGRSSDHESPSHCSIGQSFLLIGSLIAWLSLQAGFHLLGRVGGSFPSSPNNLASHPKRSTISLHHRQEHYMTETMLLKNNSIELQICTVHKAKLNRRYTTIHTNWNGTLGHTSSTASPQTWFSRWNTGRVWLFIGFIGYNFTGISTASKVHS